MGAGDEIVRLHGEGAAERRDALARLACIDQRQTIKRFEFRIILEVHGKRRELHERLGATLFFQQTGGVA